jgi:predicted Zn finger-like uncharacterized protein
MFTQCPECHTVHTVKAKELRISSGILRCKHCQRQFDALRLITEQAPQQNAAADTIDLSSEIWEEPRKPLSNRCWLAGLSVALLLLLGQAAYFEGGRLAQNEIMRPWLEKFCVSFGCHLPGYRDISRLEILRSSFRIRADQNYRLRIAIINRAEFAQAYPQLKLSLTDYGGDTFAERTFSPRDYQSEYPQARIPPKSAEEIDINIAAPTVPVGGFSLELL